jgi:2-keto-4-pentenoate hydratase/2-oxohepta-3-ene-1,7-dioic acid hydratase in catechol pathway
MKVCTFSRQTPFGRVQRLGVFHNTSTIIDVNMVWRAYYQKEGFFNAEERANHMLPSLLSETLKLVDRPIEELAASVDLFKKLTKAGMIETKEGGALSFDLNDADDARLEAPLDSIHVYRDFYAHEKHVKKGFEKRGEPIPQAWYEIPAYYKGGVDGFIGPEADIMWPSYTQKLDFELELGVVIGKDGFNIKKKDAYHHIFGLTILNDISARDIQKKEMAVRLGPAKGKDFCSIIGPVITTMDEFKFKEPKLEMTATINGEEWSRGMSSDANFSWAEMIEHASKEEWIRATDFMGSGTVGTGCGLELDRWIKPGDSIVLEIENIGKLKNTVGVPHKE